jgi:hypothetical protein
MPATEDVSALESQLQSALVEALRTEAAAVAAIDEALKAKNRSLHAWMRLQRARGSAEADFKSTYQEADILWARTMRSFSRDIVWRALHVGFWARAGLT